MRQTCNNDNKKNKKKAIAVNPNEWMKDGGMPTH